MPSLTEPVVTQAQSDIRLSLDTLLAARIRPYQYRQLKGTEVRLLELIPPTPALQSSPNIQCRIIHVPLEAAPEYEALSYVWGKSDRTHTVHIKNGWRNVLNRTSFSISVTSSLFEALKSLRFANETRRLWIDQICIDQDNTPEKNEQVPRMRFIYENAACTVIWLGNDDDSETLRKMYRSLSTQASSGDDAVEKFTLDRRALAKAVGFGADIGTHTDSTVGYRLLLERFLNLPWFNRAWVYQEAVVSGKVEVVWGRSVVPFDWIADLIVHVYSMFKSEENGEWHQKLKKTRGFGPLRAILYDRLDRKRGNLDFLNILWHARMHLDAKDDRDRVYAFLAFYTPHTSNLPRLTLQNSTSTIMPSYSSPVQEVYTDFVHTIVRSSQSLQILQYVVPTKSSRCELPSWVPDWAERRFVSGSLMVIPGVPNRFETCSGKLHVYKKMSSSLSLSVLGHVLGKVRAVVHHKFKHSYCSTSLRAALCLDEIEALVQAHLSRAKRKAAESVYSYQWTMKDVRETILRTMLADGSFTADHNIPHSLKDLLDVYDGESTFQNAADTDIEQENKHRQIRQFLRQAGELAFGKRVFLSDCFDIGLGYSNVRKDDTLCILYGSKLPCILRDVSTEADSQKMYTFVGQCYLDGWMDGFKNPRDWSWWDASPQEFILV